MIVCTPSRCLFRRAGECSPYRRRATPTVGRRSVTAMHVPPGEVAAAPVQAGSRGCGWSRQGGEAPRAVAPRVSSHRGSTPRARDARRSPTLSSSRAAPAHPNVFARSRRGFLARPAHQCEARTSLAPRRPESQRAHGAASLPRASPRVRSPTRREWSGSRRRAVRCVQDHSRFAREGRRPRTSERAALALAGRARADHLARALVDPRAPRPPQHAPR